MNCATVASRECDFSPAPSLACYPLKFIRIRRSFSSVSTVSSRRFKVSYTGARYIAEDSAQCSDNVV